jgi:hypothetical protein
MTTQAQKPSGTDMAKAWHTQGATALAWRGAMSRNVFYIEWGQEFQW